MFYEQIKEHFIERVPFFATLGFVLDHIGAGEARAQLENRKDISNHLGTLHAGAVFSLGEGTSGAAVIGAFADIIDDIRILSTQARINYTSISRGVTHCEARIIDTIESLRDQLDQKGQVECNVDVRLMTPSDKEVATMRVTWIVLKRKSKIS